MFFLKTFEKILRLNVGVSQPDNEELFRILDRIYPLKLHRFKSGQKHNGWVVPAAWEVKRALIKQKGKTLFDGTKHPLAVVQHSPSYSGKLNKDKLHKHVFYQERAPGAYAFHCSNLYRPWAKHWGFCVPYNRWKAWPNGTFEVDLESSFKPATMIVGEAVHKGKHDTTFVFNAHTCHPCQFNDGFSGVAIILELFKWLSKRKTRYTYKAILGPEHLGTVFYTAELSKKEREKITAGVFLDFVGTRDQVSYQQTFSGEAPLDFILESIIRRRDPEAVVKPFRTIVGNDETVWEAPGIEIPFGSISRLAKGLLNYPKYHTSADDLKEASVKGLTDTLETLKSLVFVLENDCQMQRKFEGLVALSNPKYDLYIQRWEPGMRKVISAKDQIFGPLQDVIVRYFDNTHSVLSLARKFQVPFNDMLDYVKGFEKKGLIKLIPCDPLRRNLAL